MSDDVSGSITTIIISYTLLRSVRYLIKLRYRLTFAPAISKATFINIK